MGKHSRCVIGACDIEMQYPELHTKHSNEDGQTSNPLTVTDNSRKSSYVSNGNPAWLIY